MQKFAIFVMFLCFICLMAVVGFMGYQILVAQNLRDEMAKEKKEREIELLEGYAQLKTNCETINNLCVKKNWTR